MSVDAVLKLWTLVSCSAVQPHALIDQTSIFEIPLGKGFKGCMSAKISEGQEGFTIWPTN